MPKSKIVINNTGIRIRPSSVDSFLGCAYQWARVFLTGETSIPNARAAIGTGVHKGVEVMWREAMQTKEKNPNLSMMADAAVESFNEEFKLSEGAMRFDDGEDINTATAEVVKGVTAYAEDIVEFTEIPTAVEEFLSIPIHPHPIVKEIAGTLDYRNNRAIADVKTSKRKATVANYEIQQSIYKELAIQNGHNISVNLIQNIVFTKQPRGEILDMPTNIPKAKMIVNNLLDSLEVLATDKVSPEVLFRGNPKYYLCSDKYCAFYNDCIFVKGEAPEEPKPKVVKL